MDHGYRGLANYEIRELPEAAQEALNKLYSLGWLSGRWISCSICGNGANTHSAAYCHRCVTHCQHLPMRGYIVKVDGTCAPRQYCGHCGTSFPDPPRRTWVYNVCFKDGRDEYRTPACERCGDERGTQLHHWAPSAIFSDASYWPTSWLCVRCHSFWHSTMRSAGAYRLSERAYIPADIEAVG